MKSLVSEPGLNSNTGNSSSPKVCGEEHKNGCDSRLLFSQSEFIILSCMRIASGV